MSQKHNGDKMTIGEMARHLAEATDEHTPGYHARQLRAWTQGELLDPAGYRGEGRTAATLFDEPQLLAARLFGVLTKIGLLPSQMAAAKRCFPNISPAPTGRKYKPGLAYVAERLREGERWHFVIHLKQYGDVTGGFKTKPEFDNPVTESLKLVSLVFDCRELFRKLLKLGND